ncbi:MAG TPA: DUF2892 domain-containing protein [Burkholderiaceae bacterium]|nr:DUF2892 domain-containing protein [Burkholderiaceae bacterium]
MNKNVGSTDRIIRAIVGIVLLALASMGNFGAYAWVGYVLGAVMLGTAAIGWCPPYSLFGINTCAVKK